MPSRPPCRAALSSEEKNECSVAGPVTSPRALGFSRTERMVRPGDPSGRGGPGASLEFGLAVAEVDGRNRVPVGVLLDDESMALLAYLGSRPVVSQRAKLGGKAGQPSSTRANRSRR